MIKKTARMIAHPGGREKERDYFINTIRLARTVFPAVARTTYIPLGRLDAHQVTVCFPGDKS